MDLRPFMERWHMLPPSGGVMLVAVSGGRDSVCLLHYLAAMPRDFSVAAAHLDHGQRPTAGRDVAFVEELCREPLGFEEILQKVFAHYQLTMDFNQYVLVGSTIRSYLAYLLDQGRLSAEFSDCRLLWRRA